MDDALTLIKTGYPAQYYGQYDASTQAATPLTTVMDVWSGITAQGSQINILSLPSSSAMVAMTAVQWALFQNAAYVWQQAGALLYPDRYYASADKNGIVNGWYDIGSLKSVDGIPDQSAMIPVPLELWNNRSGQYHVVDGILASYTPPVVPVPLKTQAQSVLQAQQTYVMQTYTVYGDVTPPDWLSYLKTLRAIANGTDTTSTALPTAPATATATATA